MQSGVAVCGTWPDSTKPHGFHYEVLKGYEVLQKSEIGPYPIARVHCKTRGEVTITKNMFFGTPSKLTPSPSARAAARNGNRCQWQSWLAQSG